MKRTKRRGQGIVELAVLFPFFLLVIIGGIIDFGFAFYNMLSLQQLANDGAQYAAESNKHLGRSSSEVSSFVISRAPKWWDSSALTVQLSDGATTNSAPTKKVTLTFQSKTYTPFYQTILSGVSGSPALTLQAAAMYQIPQKL